MKVILLSIVAVFNIQAVELSKASNSQIIKELSKRLGSPNQSNIAYISAFCRSDELTIQLDTAHNSISKQIDLRLSSTCRNAKMTIYKGQFQNLKISAFCESDNLYKIKATATGQLIITSIDHRTSSACNRSASDINRL